MPFESMVPSVWLPPVMLLTFHTITLLVPPLICAEKGVGTTASTPIDTVVGEMAMVIPVTGSVHVEEEEEDAVVAVVVVHEIAVLTGAWPPHEDRSNRAIINARNRRRLTAPLS